MPHCIYNWTWSCLSTMSWRKQSREYVQKKFTKESFGKQLLKLSLTVTCLRFTVLQFTIPYSLVFNNNFVLSLTNRILKFFFRFLSFIEITNNVETSQIALFPVSPLKIFSKCVDWKLSHIFRLVQQKISAEIRNFLQKSFNKNLRFWSDLCTSGFGRIPLIFIEHVRLSTQTIQTRVTTLISFHFHCSERQLLLLFSKT